MTKTLISSDLGESRALDVFDGAEFFGQLFAHLKGEWLLLVLGQLLDCGGVVAEIDLEIASCGTYWARNFHQIYYYRLFQLGGSSLKHIHNLNYRKRLKSYQFKCEMSCLTPCQLDSAFALNVRLVT